MTTISGGLAWYGQAGASPIDQAGRAAGRAARRESARESGVELRAWLREQNTLSDAAARRTVGARGLKSLGAVLHVGLVARFAGELVIKGGWMTGLAGVRQSVLAAMQQYWIGLKVIERERSWRRRNEDVVMRMLEETPVTAAKAAARACIARREAARAVA